MREQPRFSGFGPAGPVKRQVRPVSRRPEVRALPVRQHQGRPAVPVVPPQSSSAQSQYAKALFPEQQLRRWQVPSELQEQPKKRLNFPDFSWLKNQSKQQVAMLSAAVFIFVLGLGVALAGFKTNTHVEAQAQKLSEQHIGTENEGDHPSEEKPPEPSTVADYQVAPDKPKRISIQKLGINARIKQLGTKSNNELKAPANIYDAGWYEGSARLGERGATLLDGHVHGLTKPGVFYKLKNIAIGDRIEVERGDGKVFRYEVVKKQTYSRENMDMKAAMSPIDPALPGLNIITCTGQVDKANNTYTDRLLVQAVLVD